MIRAECKIARQFCFSLFKVGFSCALKCPTFQTGLFLSCCLYDFTLQATNDGVLGIMRHNLCRRQIRVRVGGEKGECACVRVCALTRKARTHVEDSVNH